MMRLPYLVVHFAEYIGYIRDKTIVQNMKINSCKLRFKKQAQESWANKSMMATDEFSDGRIFLKNFLFFCKNMSNSAQIITAIIGAKHHVSFVFVQSP